MSERPICINCKKPLNKYIFHVSLPFDEDAEKWIGLEAQLMDAPETIRQKQLKQATRYEARMESAREARLKLAVGSNEIVNNPQWATSVLERMQIRRIEEEAQDPDKKIYSVQVRVWRGEYGYDRRGLFHSGECARNWGTAIAAELRLKGRI
jgi:hypothetical protein